jgi:hypothetical protein
VLFESIRKNQEVLQGIAVKIQQAGGNRDEVESLFDMATFVDSTKLQIQLDVQQNKDLTLTGLAEGDSFRSIFNQHSMKNENKLLQ